MSEIQVPQASAPGTTVRPNAELIEETYARWTDSKAGSIEDMLAVLDEDIEMRSILTADLAHEVAGVHHRHAEARRYFESIPRDFEMLDFRRDRFLAEGENVVMVGSCSWRDRRTGLVLDSPKVDLWHLTDGKVTRLMEYFDSLGFARATGAVPGGSAERRPVDIRIPGRPVPRYADGTRPENPAIARVEAAYLLWSESAGASAVDFLTLMDDAVEMHSVLNGGFPEAVSGSRSGLTRAQDYFHALATDWEMLFHEIHGFIADGDDLAMVGRCAWRNRKTTKVFHSPKVDICHLEGDRVTWFLEAFDTLAFARAADAV